MPPAPACASGQRGSRSASTAVPVPACARGRRVECETGASPGWQLPGLVHPRFLEGPHSRSGARIQRAFHAEVTETNGGGRGERIQFSASSSSSAPNCRTEFARRGNGYRIPGFHVLFSSEAGLGTPGARRAGRAGIIPGVLRSLRPPLREHPLFPASVPEQPSPTLAGGGHGRSSPPDRVRCGPCRGTDAAKGAQRMRVRFGTAPCTPPSDPDASSQSHPSACRTNAACTCR